MNKRLVLLVGLFLVFAGYTIFVWLTAEVGFVAFMTTLPFNAWPAQIIVDLYISCMLICLWMFKDARGRGKPPRTVIPYVVITVFFASMGPLLYLIQRERAGGA